MHEALQKIERAIYWRSSVQYWDLGNTFCICFTLLLLGKQLKASYFSGPSSPVEAEDIGSSREVGHGEV